MLNITAPVLRAALSEQRIASMIYLEFRNICLGVHAIKDYARRVPNKSVGLADNGTPYTIPEKVDALSARIWNDQSSRGARVRDLIIHVLYAGSAEQLPERLWRGISDPRWKIDGLGVSALGELVGWALPDQFPPRNGRTSKSLKSLGYDPIIPLTDGWRAGTLPCTRRPWGWIVGVLSSAAGACGIAGRAIMDAIGLANLPGDAGSGAQAFAAAVLWLASTGPVGAYIFNGLLLAVGVLTPGYQASNALRAKHVDEFSDKAAMALAIQKASEAEVPLVREMGDLVRDKIVGCYDRALDLLSVVDDEVERVGSLWLDEPHQLWQAVSQLNIRPFLLGTNLRSLASPAFPLHGTMYLFQHELYVEMERYNAVMAIIMRHATQDRFDVDFKGGAYRGWLEADIAMRRAFVGLCVRGDFPELSRLVRPNWGEKEREEWKTWVNRQASQKSRLDKQEKKEN